MMEALKQSMLRTELWLAITVLLGIPAVIIFALPKSRIRQVLLHWLLWLAGGISFVLGILGIFLPVLPTTPFTLISAKWCKTGKNAVPCRAVPNIWHGA